MTNNLIDTHRELTTQIKELNSIITTNEKMKTQENNEKMSLANCLLEENKVCCCFVSSSSLSLFLLF